MPTTASAQSPRASRRGRGIARTAAALLAGAATTLAGSVVGVPAHAEEEPPPPVSDVTMVQANIKSALSVEKFQADVREVIALEADFVTYNEVPWRYDGVIAPDNYAVYRSFRNRYTKATAVAWREDRWTAIDQGTFRISNYREIPRGKNIMLGLRFANWVTLESYDGRQVSVVATHIAPLTKDMPDLARRSVRRLNRLVETLAPRGPVLVGGDFNFHYDGPRYPRDLLEAGLLEPTYDTLGYHFSTGDHQGATIDYVFNRGTDQLVADAQSKRELHSDHDAVVAGLSWLVDAPTDTQRVVNDPQGDQDARRRAVIALRDQFHATEPGSRLEVVTSHLGLRALYRGLKRALNRGVHVGVTTRSADLTRRERQLARQIAAQGDPHSYLRQCRDECLQTWRDSTMRRGFVLVSDLQGEPSLRIDVNRNLNQSMLKRRTRVVLRTGDLALDDGRDMLAELAAAQ